jgi:hypothetical protein
MILELGPRPPYLVDHLSVIIRICQNMHPYAGIHCNVLGEVSGNAAGAR